MEGPEVLLGRDVTGHRVRRSERTSLRVGRLRTVVVALVALYAALTASGRPVARVLAPVLVPRGRTSLYVFLMRVLFALLVANSPVPQPGRVLWRTIAHTLVLARWLRVRARFLFPFVAL